MPKVSKEMEEFVGLFESSLAAFCGHIIIIFQPLEHSEVALKLQCSYKSYVQSVHLLSHADKRTTKLLNKQHTLTYVCTLTDTYLNLRHMDMAW